LPNDAADVYPRECSLATYEFQCAVGFESDRGTAIDAFGQLAERVELTEPFSRIHEAIREAQRIGGRGSIAHDQAA